MSAKLLAFLKLLAKEGITPSEQQLLCLQWVDAAIIGRMSKLMALQLIARAGCGKTFTLILLVRYIAYCGAGTVLLSAFNTRIVKEIAQKLVAVNVPANVAVARTINGAGFDACWSISRNVKGSKVWDIIDELGMAGAENNVYVRHGAILKQLVGFAKGRAFGVIDCPTIDDTNAWMDIFVHYGLFNKITEDDNPVDIIAGAQHIYRESLRLCMEGRKVIDFDDQMLAPLYFGAKFKQFDWVFGDEGQDFSNVKRLVMFASLKPNGVFGIVGDPKQAINGFAGADVTSMEDTAKALVVLGYTVETLKLTVTRRCPKKVVEFIRATCPGLEDFTAHPSAIEGTVEQHLAYKNLLPRIMELTGDKPTADVAILCRKTPPLLPLAYNMISLGIPCRIEGKEISDDLLKLCGRWKKAKTLKAFREQLDNFRKNELEKKKRKVDGKTDEAKTRLLEKMMMPLDEKLDCMRILIQRCESVGKTQVADLETEIRNIFVDEPTEKELESGVRRNYPVLSTVHKSKGREWRLVFVLGYYEFMPSKMAREPWEKEQEEHIIYVGDSRTLDYLGLVHAPEDLKKTATETAQEEEKEIETTPDAPAVGVPGREAQIQPAALDVLPKPATHPRKGAKAHRDTPGQPISPPVPPPKEPKAKGRHKGKTAVKPAARPAKPKLQLAKEPKLKKDGKPRKVRSDAGKPRGPRKGK